MERVGGVNWLCFASPLPLGFQLCQWTGTIVCEENGFARNAAFEYLVELTEYGRGEGGTSICLARCLVYDLVHVKGDFDTRGTETAEMGRECEIECREEKMEQGMEMRSDAP